MQQAGHKISLGLEFGASVVTVIRHGSGQEFMIASSRIFKVVFMIVVTVKG